MGSLMSGWDSPVIGDEKKVRLMRNHSLTKEEVDAFWRRQARKTPVEDGNTSPLGSPRAGNVSPLGSPRAGNVSPLGSPRAGNVSPLGSPRAGVDVSPLASPGRAQQQQQQQQREDEMSSPLRRLERMSSMPSPLARSAMTRTDPYEVCCCHSEPPSPAATRADYRCLPDEDGGPGMSSECWWTRSSWAFLNETPSPEEEMFGRRQTYSCVQFHVAQIVTGNA
ncbi:hypothetical protein GUJ93_ZPchr0003g18590 [Zizania palustris]|uniref:Uncharacterized protein n=1 Tax=Zizania palustris TaxID=103762 RepID=A0A8J5VD82_ZIZPA|nr:hypothetical protein GUJ93_ZPchr0003g18590 [Zizania palustris]